MSQKTGKRKQPQHGEAVATGEEPVEETLIIRQRLRNLCELAIAIGQKQGLLGNHDIADS